MSSPPTWTVSTGYDGGWYANSSSGVVTWPGCIWVILLVFLNEKKIPCFHTIYSAWDLLLSVANVHSEISFYKTNFFLCKWLLIRDSILVKMGAGIHFPVWASGPHLAWSCAGPVHAATVSVNSYLCQPCCISKTVLPWALHHLFMYLLALSLERPCSKVSHSLHLV